MIFNDVAMNFQNLEYHLYAVLLYGVVGVSLSCAVICWVLCVSIIVCQHRPLIYLSVVCHCLEAVCSVCVRIPRAICFGRGAARGFHSRKSSKVKT